MAKIDEAKEILNTIGMPPQQQNEICCYALLTLAQLEPNTPWQHAINPWIRIHDSLSFASG